MDCHEIDKRFAAGYLKLSEAAKKEE